MEKNLMVKKWGSSLLVVSLVAGSLVPTLHPYQASAAVGQGVVTDTMFEDLNGNKIQDNGEKGVAGIQVKLYNDQGQVVKTVTTDATGKYLFDNLDDGTYYLNVDVNNLPSDEKLFSAEGINPSDGNSSYFTISNGSTVTGNFFTFTPVKQVGTSSIKDAMFEDLNGNSQKDSGENGVAGIKVQLYSDQGELIQTSTTDANGEYAFTEIPNGTYYIHVDTATIPSNEKLYTTQGIGGDGNSGYITITGDQSITGYHFGLYPQRGTIQSFVYNDVNGNGQKDGSEAGIPNVTVSLYDYAGNKVGTAVTDSTGAYGFSVQPGRYYAQANIPSGYQYASSTYYGADGSTGYFTVGNEQNLRNELNLGLKTTANSSVAGSVKSDQGAGLSGVTVELHDVQGNTIATQKTDASGNYSFQQVAQGDYYTKVLIPTDYSFVSGQGYGSDGNSNYVHATGDNAITGYSVTLKQQANANISGLINTTTDAGVSDQNVSLYNVDGTLVKTVATAADGSFAFGSLPAGDYYVKAPIPGGYTFASSNGFGSDGNSYYLHVGNNDTINNLRLTLAQETGQIRSTVFEDLNKNGTQETGEVGILGATVTLYNTDGTVKATTKTDSNGLYVFENIAPSNYYVKVTPPAGYSVLANSAFGKDGVSGYIKLDTNQTRTDMNASLVKVEQFSSVGWIYNKTLADDGVVTEGETISVFESYVDKNNYHNLNFNLKDKDGKVLDPSDYEITSSNPSVATIGLGNNGAPLYVARIQDVGSTLITIKDNQGNVLRKYTINIKASAQNVGWIYNKDASADRSISNNDVITVPETYLDEYNNNNVNFNLKDKDGNVLDPHDYTFTSSNTGVATMDYGTNGAKLYVARIQGPGSTLITVKDVYGQVVRQYTLNVTTPADIAVTSITLSATNISATVGDTGKINATVAPANATNKALSYTPADSSIISVDSNGNWTAKKAGTTTIAVKTTDGSNITKTITVTVKAGDVGVAGVVIAGPYNVNVGGAGQVSAWVTPDNATHQELVYSVDDPSIVSIDPNTGKFTGLKVGSTTVYAKSPSVNITVKTTINVNPIKATDITLGATNIAAKVGDTGKVNATVAPANTTNKTLTYTPADSSIISVDANGNWTAKKAGTTTIAVKTTDGSNITKTITVTVSPADIGVASVVIAGPYNVDVGGAGQVNAWVTPDNATHQELVYSVDDPSIVSIDPNTGKFTGLKVGSTTVYAKSPSVNITVKTVINVNPVKATDITLGATDITTKVGDTGKISATVAPSNTANKTLTYTPADSTIISVDANGNWTAKKEGTTTIAVKTTDGSNITKTITVKVGPAVAVSGVVISGPYNVKVGATGQVQAHVNPTNATHQELVYTVDDPSIVSINANTGAFTGLKEGSTTVYATSPSTGVTVKTTINIASHFSSIVEQGNFNGDKPNGGPVQIYNAIEGLADKSSVTLTYNALDAEKESDQQTNGRRQIMFYVDGAPADFNNDYSFSISNTTVLNPNITNNNTDTRALGHIEVQVTKGTSTITVKRKSDNMVVKTMTVTVQ
ncbi:SdrD B-like domain-containing protein [Listeria booriae]|uniref:BIG2 domain-containing protein n=1 Tax=Listeria booriae TaxID=1552123 RepID=A0A841ZY47_9LIST|nr:SdrD B-like domain-containing protein [Listeria booriae]MBC1565679.1 hypothetical protein [Listeria booriae]